MSYTRQRRRLLAALRRSSNRPDALAVVMSRVAGERDRCDTVASGVRTACGGSVNGVTLAAIPKTQAAAFHPAVTRSREYDRVLKILESLRE